MPAGNVVGTEYTSHVDTDVAPRPTGGTKLASSVATRIVDDIIAKGWPTGEVLGSETELLERYGVSRAVFREAVRLVEHQGVGRMRRGPGGGLVVTEPTSVAVIDAMLTFLYYTDARLDEVLSARLLLEALIAELAPDRLSETDMVALRELAEQEVSDPMNDPRSLHALLAQSTGNVALELFVEVLNTATIFYVPNPRGVSTTVHDSLVRAHTRIIEAVLSGEAGLARHRMVVHLDAERDWLRTARPSGRLRPPPMRPLGGRGNKRAEAVSRAIFREILAGGWEVGTLVGSEAELMERYQVSRAVLREAIRLQEHHNVAVMRRGPGGGLFVAEPTASATTDAVALYLEHRGIRVSDLFEVRAVVELAMLDLVVERLDDEGVERLRGMLSADRQAGDEPFTEDARDLHAVLASLSGNRVLELLALVLFRLTRLHSSGNRRKSVKTAVMGEAQASHDGIVAAVIARDAGVARRRMRRQLDALGKILR